MRRNLYKFLWIYTKFIMQPSYPTEFKVLRFEFCSDLIRLFKITISLKFVIQPSYLTWIKCLKICLLFRFNPTFKTPIILIRIFLSCQNLIYVWQKLNTIWDIMTNVTNPNLIFYVIWNVINVIDDNSNLGPNHKNDT